MPQDIHIMLLLITECQKWLCLSCEDILLVRAPPGCDNDRNKSRVWQMLCQPCNCFWSKHGLNTRNLLCINWLACLMGRYSRNLFHLLHLLLTLCYCIWETSHTVALPSLHLAVFHKILTSVWLSLVWSFKSDSRLSIRYYLRGN